MKKRAFAATNKSHHVLKASSSGGVFYTLAKYYLTKLQGVVYGVVFNGREVHHQRIDKIQHLEPLLKSKYCRSKLMNCFLNCERDLLDGRNVLFVGTPCQISSLAYYLERKQIDKTRLLTIDFICHGTPKSIFLHSYLTEKYNNEEICDIDFRNKKKSWENFQILIRTKNKTISKSPQKDEFMVAFLKNYTLEETCYSCMNKGENRKSDITLGDFWGVKTFYPEFYRKNGVSLIIFNNENEMILNKLEDELELNEVDYANSVILNPSYYQSSIKPQNYEQFINEYKEHGFISAFNKCIKFPKIKIDFSYILNKIKNSLPIKSASKKNKSLKEENVIGIITDYTYSNFGNRLQNYSLRKYCIQLGYKVENLYYKNYYKYAFSWLFDLYTNIKQFVFNHSEWKKANIIHSCCKKTKENNSVFAYSPFYKNKINKYSTILIGSDQVWNWTYHTKDLNFDLGFLGISQKNTISFAASLGVDYIPAEKKELFKLNLEKMSYVGVREKSTSDILNDLGIENVINADPVFLTDCNEWIKSIELFSQIKVPNNDYILKYLLKSTCAFEQPGEVDIIDVLDKNTDYYYINQFDFINLIKESALIITDSFHAFCFSIIFKKQVYLVRREGMENRFDIIFNLFDIKDPYNRIIDFKIMDYSKFNTFIKESENFLTNSLSEYKNIKIKGEK